MQVDFWIFVSCLIPSEIVGYYVTIFITKVSHLFCGSDSPTGRFTSLESMDHVI